MTNFSISRYKNVSSEIEDYAEAENEIRQKRSRKTAKPEAETSTNDVKLELWCPSLQANSTSSIASRDLASFVSIFDPGPSELYTQLLMGNETSIPLVGKESCFWDPYRRNDKTPFEFGSLPKSICDIQQYDASSNVMLGKMSLPEPDMTHQNNRVENKDISSTSATGCFSQDVWDGMMKDIPGSDWDNILAGGNPL